MNMIQHFSVRLSILLILILAVTIIIPVNIFQPIGPIDSSQDMIDREFIESKIALNAASAGHSDDKQIIEQIQTSSSEATRDVDASDIGAFLIDGKVVPMTQSQVDELEAKLADCKSQEELEALMSNVAYYNKGIDCSGYEWYWDSKRGIYTDNQIAILRSPKIAVKMPNIIGMDYRQAYDCLTDLGLVVRIIFYFNPNSSMPVNCIYNQDINAGCTIYTNAALQIYAQAPSEIYLDVSIPWYPDDNDFDIYQVAAELRENGVIAVKIPNVIGMTEQEAVSLLEGSGLKNVVVRYAIGDQNIAPGICLSQAGNPGTYTLNNQIFSVFIQQEPEYTMIPDVVGLLESEAVENLQAAGFNVECEYKNDYDHETPAGICFWQSCSPGKVPGKVYYIYLHIQASPIETTESATTGETTDIQESSGDTRS